MSARNYKNTAPATTLVGNITSIDINITVNDAAGFPSVPFTATLDRTTSTEEVILVTVATGNTFTATRGYDGTIAQDHSATTRLEHVAAAIDYREANAHIQASTAVHGATGSIVGTEGAQSLEDKTLLDPKITGVADAYALRIEASPSGALVDASTGGTSQFRVARDGAASSGAVNVTDNVNAAVGTTQGVYLTKDGKAVITATAASAGPELNVKPPDAAAGVKSIGVGSGFRVDRDGKTTAKGLLVNGDEQVTGDLAVGGTASVTGDTTLGGALAVTGDTTLGGALAVTGRADIGGDITGGNDASFSGTVGVGTLVSGAATFNGYVRMGAYPIPRTMTALPGVAGVAAPNSSASVLGSAALTFDATHAYEVTGLFEYGISNAVFGDMALTISLDATQVGIGWRKRFTDVGTNSGHGGAVTFSVMFKGQSGSHAVRGDFHGSTYGGNTAIHCWWFKVTDLGLASDLGW